MRLLPRDSEEKKVLRIKLSDGSEHVIEFETEEACLAMKKALDEQIKKHKGTIYM